MFGGASSVSDKVDSVFLYISALTIAFLVFITFLMIYLVVRYRRSRNQKPEDIHGHTGLEIVWTVVPLLLFLSMFYYGWTNYRYLREVPRDAMVIKVTARQWAWAFTYPNGKQTTELYVPGGRPIRLDLKSVDVLHGFYIPAFRIKSDVVPGRDTYTWFEATKEGDFDIECTVMCGANHSYMLSKVHVIPEAAFSSWYFGDSTEAPELAQIRSGELPPEARGKRVYKLKGCVGCHTIDGSPLVGPSWKGLYGSNVTLLVKGQETTVKADDAYIRRAVKHPPDEVVKGFEPQMPDLNVTEKDIDDVIAFMKTLR